MKKPNEIISANDISKVIGMSAGNIRRTYRNIPEKADYYEVLQIGAFCKMKGISITQARIVLSAFSEAKDG